MNPTTRRRLEALHTRLADIDLDECDLGDELLHAYEEIGHILRAQPRLTEVSELEELPLGAVVRDDADNTWRKWSLVDDAWEAVGDNAAFPSSEITLPATVLWEPEVAA